MLEKPMKRIVSSVLVVLLLSGISLSQGGIEITLKRGSKGEAQTKDQLLRLLKTYDVAKWTFTKSIIIEEDAIPHSHPVLTLSARHVKDDELLLSSFVHRSEERRVGKEC